MTAAHDTQPVVGRAEGVGSAALKLANKLDASSDKFIVSEWDPSYGQLPAGKKFALSHWSATLASNKATVASQEGHRQLCGQLSGAVVESFVKQFPLTSAPEPGAA